MSTGKRILIMALALIVTGAFFMPWINLSESISASDFIFGTSRKNVFFPFQKEIGDQLKYLGLIIPVSAILLFFDRLFNIEKYRVPRVFLSFIPIITLIVIIKISYTALYDFGVQIVKFDISLLTKNIGIGLWLSLIGSSLLPLIFLKGIKKKQTEKQTG